MCESKDRQEDEQLEGSEALGDAIDSIAVYAAAAVLTAVISIACIFVIKRNLEKREIDGHLVKVNYRFSKDFE